jgi:hypothetical protein
MAERHAHPLDIEDDVLFAAKEIARREKKSLGDRLRDEEGV